VRIFDIGTNHGHFTEEYLFLYSNIEVVCVEANPNLYENLQLFEHLIPSRRDK
jgi:hypothetical protein